MKSSKPIQEIYSSTVEAQPALEAWKRSRSGAWAGRGFRYQHLVTALILVRQWAGLAPTGCLVPEGFEDCVVEFSGHQIWIQIKSRKEAKFGKAEVHEILNSVNSKVAKINNRTGIRSAVILEQPRTNETEFDITRLFDDSTQNVFVCEAPGEEIVKLFLKRLEIAEVIAEGLASDLYKLVADTSAENASLPFSKRRKISTTEVELRIFERLKAEDPTAIDHALASGALEPVDFTTPVYEPDFYRGVKVKAGHVAANLVMDRTDDVKKVVDLLWTRRHVLVTGPSGAGKSALVWLVANTVSGQLRWFQITGMATATHAEAIITFTRARRPAENSPIGLVFDEVGSANTHLLDMLVHELRGLPAVYVLGSVRQEDVNLISNQSDTEFIPITLDETLAQTVWEKLSAQNHTEWNHWREPFEQSEGLMLEYVHLLTQGQRLAAVIGEQIRQREHESRHDELAILRSAAVISVRGGEVESSRLFELLDLDPTAANIAMRRLIDEHLVCESRPGVLGGLHLLRSNALVTASHDETVYLTTDTLWKSLLATTGETLPRTVQSILTDASAEIESQVIQNLADIIGNSHDIDQWVGILTGLGLATLERHVASFMSMLDQHGLERAHWSLAAMFSDPYLDLLNRPEFERLEILRNAVLEFRSLPKHDLRAICMRRIPEGSMPPPCDRIHQANKLLSCLVPICGGEPIQIALRHEYSADQNFDIRELARLLSTAYLIEPNLAESLVNSLGGEQALFDLFHSQIPWTTPPTIDPKGAHGRTVRSNWYYFSESYQPNPHETVCDICEILIALSPCSDAAASDAVDPMGRTIVIGHFNLASKNMPRKNIPAKARVAWNVAFRQILLSRSADYSLTEYTHQMALLVKRTERVFRSISEKWIRGKQIGNFDTLVSEVNKILDVVNALAYTTPVKPPSAMTEPIRSGTDDTLGALLTGVLGNLITRLCKFDSAKSTATFAGSLADQARGHYQSDIWRTMSSPPLKNLTTLSDRLADIACILHEIAYNNKPEAIHRIVKVSKRARLGTAVSVVARHCRNLANRRLKSRLRKLEHALSQRGWNARCLSRAIDESDSVYWPAREVAILIELTDFETQLERWIEETISLGRLYLKDDWLFSTAPVMNEQVLVSLAFRPSSYMPLLDADFARNWTNHLDKPIFSSALEEAFDKAIEACMQISALFTVCDWQNLIPEEVEFISKVVDTFNRNRKIIASVTDRTESENFALALDYIDHNWNRVVDESESVKAGRVVEDPLYMTNCVVPDAEKNEHASEIFALRLLILREECGGCGGYLNYKNKQRGLSV